MEFENLIHQTRIQLFLVVYENGDQYKYKNGIPWQLLHSFNPIRNRNLQLQPVVIYTSLWVVEWELTQKSICWPFSTRLLLIHLKSWTVLHLTKVQRSLRFLRKLSGTSFPFILITLALWALAMLLCWLMSALINLSLFIKGYNYTPFCWTEDQYFHYVFFTFLLLTSSTTI